jgi:hypothetical protein
MSASATAESALTFMGRSLAIELVYSTVRDTGLSIDMRLIAATGGRLAAVRVAALNNADAFEPTVSSLADHRKLKPRNSVRLGGVEFRGWTTDDLAAIGELPRWAREMTANDVAAVIEQARVRCLELPGERIGVLGAAIDLVALRMHTEDELGALWRTQRLRGNNRWSEPE